MMARGEVDLIVTGADRIAAQRRHGEQDRDILARRARTHHEIPLYVVAPTSTVDLATATGADIPIEERDPAEITARFTARNPAFDVTPAALIAAIVTESGVHRPPTRLARRMKALILARRLRDAALSADGDVAKPLLPLAGRPMLDYLLDRIREADEIDEVHLVTNHKFAGSFAEWARRRATSSCTTTARRARTTGSARSATSSSSSSGPACDDDLLVIAGDNLFDYSLDDYVALVARPRRGQRSRALRRRRPRAREAVLDVDVDADDRLVASSRSREHADSTLVATAAYLYHREHVPLIRRYLDEGNPPDQPGRLRRLARPARARSTAIRPPASWRDIGDAAQLLEADNRLRDLAGPALPGFLLPRLECRPVASTELRAEDIRWNLTDLCEGAEEARAQWLGLVETAQGARVALPRHDRRRSTPPALRALLDEADELEQDLSRLQVYSYLRLSMAATDVEANDLATFSRDRVAEIENTLVFLGLEWIALDDDRAEQLLAADELAPYAHKLRVEREEKPYVLSEPEEQALNARRPMVSAWQALHDRHVSTLEVPFDAGEGEQPHTISQLLSYLYRPDRDIRVRAVTALFEGLEPRADVLAACYDALVGDRLSTDRLRGYANPMQPTNLGERARRRDGRGDDERDRGGVSDRAQVVRGEGAPARSRQARARRPVRADRRGAPLQLARGGRHRRLVLQSLLAAARRDLPLVHRRRPRRRAAAERQVAAAPTARRSRRRSCRTS